MEENNLQELKNEDLKKVSGGMHRQSCFSSPSYKSASDCPEGLPNYVPDNYCCPKGIRPIR